MSTPDSGPRLLRRLRPPPPGSAGAASSRASPRPAPSPAASPPRSSVTRSGRPRTAPATGNNVLVVLSLRGGIDGLGVVVPHGDPGYYAARPTIAVPRTPSSPPDALFGLHPGLQPLEWAVHRRGARRGARRRAAVPNRSHFSAMEEVEDADPGSVARRGWVNRMIGLDDSRRPHRRRPPDLVDPAHDAERPRADAGRRARRPDLAVGAEDTSDAGRAAPDGARPHVGRRLAPAIHTGVPLRRPHRRQGRAGRAPGLHARGGLPDARGRPPTSRTRCRTPPS